MGALHFKLPHPVPPEPLAPRSCAGSRKEWNSITMRVSSVVMHLDIPSRLLPRLHLRPSRPLRSSDLLSRSCRERPFLMNRNNLRFPEPRPPRSLGCCSFSTGGQHRQIGHRIPSCLHSRKSELTGARKQQVKFLGPLIKPSSRTLGGTQAPGCLRSGS
jgi:hypothetical protein